MTLREKLREHFNVEAITAEPASEKTQLMLFGTGFREGMLAAAALLDETWFKTQQECAEAIRREAGKV